MVDQACRKKDVEFLRQFQALDGASDHACCARYEGEHLARTIDGSDYAAIREQFTREAARSATEFKYGHAGIEVFPHGLQFASVWHAPIDLDGASVARSWTGARPGEEVCAHIASTDQSAIEAIVRELMGCVFVSSRMKRDGRELDHATLEDFRVLALRRVEEGDWVQRSAGTPGQA